MPIIQLVVAVCLNSNPAICSEERFSFMEQVTTTTCTMRAMPYLAKWAGDHPQYKIKSWKCSYPNVNEQDA
ncbi:hypothetical protein [Acuticoccus yangtzensis]|uniref:hypothetical protein n=1 Tax=Acuticoccus yangtzensis TaxID=1443441 RepID=UPI0009497CCC|nr:hypothetical protein [Acuticoccus yangtzensis]